MLGTEFFGRLEAALACRRTWHSTITITAVPAMTSMAMASKHLGHSTAIPRRKDEGHVVALILCDDDGG
jgi:hypothetical protein